MIHAFGQPEPPVPRLLEALAERGHAVRRGPAGRDRAADTTLLLGPGIALDPMAAGVLFGAWRSAPGARVLVVSRIGAHPDARAPRLRALWDLEEQARASGLPVLTLRLAPLLGPQSPLWLRLRSRPPLPARGRWLLNPVIEADAVETIHRALIGQAAWEGWYEVAGEDVWSLAELAALARRAGPRLPRGAGAWEPVVQELREQKLAEAAPWRDHFGVVPRAIEPEVLTWAA